METFSNHRLPAQPRLVFMGTPEFALPALEALLEQGHDIRAVVTQPDRPRGRGRKMAPPPVKELALRHGIEVLQHRLVAEEACCSRLAALTPDLIVVVAFGQLLPRALLDIPRWPVINLHPSLLPRYRGAAPIQRAILNDEAETGMTVMQMEEGLDSGPILYQEATPIGKDETAGQLHDRLALLGGKAIVRTLDEMARTGVRALPQDDALATYAPKIEREDGLVDWGLPARRVSALIRALDPRPGAYTFLKGEEIKLFSARVMAEDRPAGVPGRADCRKEGLFVETGRGVVEIREIQVSGRRRLPACDFLRGCTVPAGTVLGK